MHAVPFIVPATVELRFDGRPVATTAWPGSEAVRGDVGVFAPEDGADGDTLILIGAGSGCYKPDPLVVAAPSNWSVRPHGEAGTVESLADAVEDGRRLWRVTGAAVLRSPEGDAHRIAAGQSGAGRDQLLLSGARPLGLESDEAEIEFFAGAPSIRVCEGQQVRSSRTNEIWWRPAGERGWRPPPFGSGLIDMAWRDPDTGFLRDRRRIFVLPAEARLHCRAEGVAAVYTPEGFGAWALTPAGDDLTAEPRGGDTIVRFTQRPSCRVRFPLGADIGRSLRVSAAFPLRWGIARWSGERVQGRGSGAPATPLTLAELADCVAFGNGAHTLHAALLDRDRRPLPSGAARWVFADELPLRGVAEDLAALLKPFADIDVVAELTFDHGAERWQVRQFEAALVLHAGRIASVTSAPTDETLSLLGRSLDDLASPRCSRSCCATFEKSSRVRRIARGDARPAFSRATSTPRRTCSTAGRPSPSWMRSLRPSRARATWTWLPMGRNSLATLPTRSWLGPTATRGVILWPAAPFDPATLARPRLRTLLDRLTGAGHAVTLCLDEEVLRGLDEAQRLGLRDAAVRHGLRLTTGAAPRFRHGSRAVAALADGRIWASRDEAAARFGDGWGLGQDAPVVVFAGSLPAYAPFDRDQLLPKSGTAFIEVKARLDGPSRSLGDRFSALVRPYLEAVGRWRPGQLTALSYTDRYVSSPLVALLVVRVAARLAAMLGSPQHRPRFHLATAPLRAQEGAPYRLVHDWRVEADRERVLRHLCGDRLDLHLTVGPCAHSRRLTLIYADGSEATIVLDQGFGFLRLVAQPPRFEFQETAAAQAKRLGAIDVSCTSDGTTYLVVVAGG